MDIILMEQIAKLGKVGQTVSVSQGFARNYLLPTGKALLASRENKAVFEKKRADIEKKSAGLEAKALDLVKKIDKKDLVMIRQAGETGRLYGSVSARDIADYLTQKFGEPLSAAAIILANPFKEVGIFPVFVLPYGDVRASIRIVVAQTQEEGAALLTAEKEEALKAKKQASAESKLVKEVAKEENVQPVETAEEIA